jgi:hypothetical protein
MNNDEVRESMNRLSQGISSAGDMATQLSEIIWGAVVTTTRAFDKVTLRIDTNTNRIFVSIKLRWFAKHQRFKRLHDAWLARANRRCKEHVPPGWKLLVYYDRKEES